MSSTGALDSTWEVAYVGLGSNLGDRAAQLSAAVEAVGAIPAVRVRRGSRLYESAPVGVVDQPWFVNAVLEIETALPPVALLSALEQVEQGLGRQPSRRWGERAIDLDVLLYGSETVHLPDLQVPHAELWNRRFVLLPLAELRPDLVGLDGRGIGQVADELGSEQEVRLLHPVPSCWETLWLGPGRRFEHVVC